MACGLYPAAEVELAAFARPIASAHPKSLPCWRQARRFTKAMLRHGLVYVRQRYGHVGHADDMPAVLAAGQQDLQSLTT